MSQDNRKVGLVADEFHFSGISDVISMRKMTNVGTLNVSYLPKDINTIIKTQRMHGCKTLEQDRWRQLNIYSKMNLIDQHTHYIGQVRHVYVSQ
jgi:hypothetical protein